MKKSINTPIQYLKGIGPKRAKAFSKSGLSTIEDLFYYFPLRYEDRANLLPIAKLKLGQLQAIRAKVISISQRQSWKKRGFKIIEAIAGDATGNVICVWFNQPYLKEYLKPGSDLVLYGRVERYASRLQMNSPEFEIILEENKQGFIPKGTVPKSLDIGRIVPIYSLPEHATQRYLRKIIYNALGEYLPRLAEFLPYDIRSRNNLDNLVKALRQIHFPDSQEQKQEAFRRLSFDEFLFFQIPLALRKRAKKDKPGIMHQTEGRLTENFINALPFKLTAAQERVIAEIKADMARPSSMQRLLQGDVGSGKTVVATIAALIAVQGGHQAAFMVPTEILAKQHYEKIKSQVRNQKPEVRIAVLISGLNGGEKEKIYREINEGKIDLVIGTHALLEESVKFKNLGLVVIDEQHKFGVGQRALLPKKGAGPDILIMTATPIPRTLAITLYGDLDISVINELPGGRIPVETVHFNQEDAGLAYELARRHLRNGSQVYIIYPVIEESYMLDIAGAKRMHAELKKDEFRDFKIGLVHGKLKQKEQDEAILKFINKELDILIATTILEVGIDIPQANCMIIEHAQRFGLAQLHQLRGRIGRGNRRSLCILVSDISSAPAEARIKAMLEYRDGFRIAEEDLKIRGPGEFFGQRQHGLSELKIADPLTQTQLLKQAREEAVKLINSDPNLSEKQNLLLREKLLQRFPEYQKLILVG